jgi:coenzyme F420-reducing hydrogenase delta subunit
MTGRYSDGEGGLMNVESPRIFVFYCDNSYDQARLMRDYRRTDNQLEVVSLPCSGKLDILYLIKAFETGADGAAVMMCREGECRYLEGNLRARKRAETVSALLQEAGLGADRVAVIQMDDAGIERAMQQLEDFRLRIAGLVKKSRSGVLESQ